ncbi:hypothetical protein FHX42_005279 [Saccharopolyspora lacisalsi]|uniref:Uncharacterized protein n=1 Tax=Halosaccharopolyspora lacisalsi TaxID=1000566 RepID=A0A839E101_9PSEU|nr:hypothetical protein [Halosaccharopolyspora lacisalsi]MBA8827872.1 hypothetical protein [Halosaccharopolyspora lacisalsi]
MTTDTVHFHVACTVLSNYRDVLHDNPGHEPAAFERATVADAHSWLDDYMATHYPTAPTLRSRTTGRIVWHRPTARPAVTSMVMLALAVVAYFVTLTSWARMLPPVAALTLACGILVALAYLATAELSAWSSYRKARKYRSIP